MHRHTHHGWTGIGTAAAALLLTCSSVGLAAGGWDVAQAPVRFTLKLTGAPTHPSAGYFVHIPDGGVLPKPFPQPQVVASDGSVVPSFVLWQNPATGLGVVFQAPPAGGDVSLYVLPSRRLPLWTPASGLTPSAMLCTQSGRGTRADALALAKLGAVSTTVQVRNRAGVAQAPLSIPGDLSGRTGPCAIYMLAHVATLDPGKTWMAPISFAGKMEIRVDGQVLKIEKRINKPAGTGQYVELAAGLHRMEIFCWAPQGHAPRNGLLTMMWQTPKTTSAQMGGVRPADLPFPGTPMWAGRKLHANEIVRSGTASVVSAVTRDGGPVAAFEVKPLENLWFEGEPPVMVYNLAARTAGSPAGTSYTWSFGNGSQAITPTIPWLVEGGRDLHRMEIFCWTPQGHAPRNGLLTMMWQTPKTTSAQMGGVRPADLPFPGTPMWAGRKLHANEIVRSGTASVVSAVTRDGGPVAAFEVKPLENLWFEGEPPVMVYNLAARTAGSPAGTSYTWSFGNGSQAVTPTIPWLVEGGRDHRVSLTATAGSKRSTCQVPFYPYATQRTSLNSPASRERYLAAVESVFAAYPAKADPTADWHQAHWNNMFRCLELNKQRDLLTHLVEVRWDLLAAKLPPERLALLQELALDFAPRVDPQLALKWIALFEAKARGSAAKAQLAVMRAEVTMYELADLAAAKAILGKVVRYQRKNEAAELARIRLGDVALMEGDLNAAMQAYGEVQTRARPRDMRAAATAASPKAKSSTALGKQPAVAEWKMNALLDVSASETVKGLIDQGFLLEAKQALRRWERAFPQSKLSGDLLLNEARFYMAVQDWRRARAILTPYCEHVDASSFMPAAAEALLACKLRLEEPDDEIVVFCKKMIKKLAFHPAALEMEEELRRRE